MQSNRSRLAGARLLMLAEVLESRIALTTTPIVAQPWTNNFYFHNNSGNSHAKASDFTVTINWGDGTKSVSSAILPNSTAPNPVDFYVTLTHVFKTAGPQTQNSDFTVNYHGTGKQITWVQTQLHPSVHDATITTEQGAIAVTKGSTYNGIFGEFAYENPFATASDFLISPAWTDPVTHQKPTATLTGDGHVWKLSISGAHFTSPSAIYDISVTHKLPSGANGSGAGVKTRIDLLATGDVFASKASAVNTLNADAAAANDLAMAVNSATEASRQFWGGVESWASNTFNSIATILNQPAGAPVAKLAAAISAQVNKFMTSSLTQNVTGIAQTINTTALSVATQLQTNPARFLGENVPNVLLLLATSGTSTEAAVATEALAEVSEIKVAATALKGELSTTEKLGSIGSHQALANTTEAIKARATVGQTVLPAGTTINSAPIFLKGELAMYASGKTAVSIYSATKLSDSSTFLLKTLMQDTNALAWKAETNANGTIGNYLQNCADTASIVAGRANQFYGAGPVPRLPASAEGASSFANKALLTSRFGGTFGNATTVTDVVATNMTASGARGIALYPSGDVLHAITLLNLGKDGIWFIDGQLQRAIQYQSKQWFAQYGTVPSGTWQYLKSH